MLFVRSIMYECGVSIVIWNHLLFLPQGNPQLIHSNKQALTTESAHPRSRSDIAAAGQGSQLHIFPVLV